MIEFTLNGEKKQSECEPNARLLDILRDTYQMTGTKEGCGEGECGACSVLVNGKLVNSCLMPMGSLQGAEVMTIEGFRNTPQYQVLEEAFAAAGAVQCGFCTPGMIMAAQALLIVNASPTEVDIREAISGNLCRCTGYNMIIDAILMASRQGAGLW